MMILAPGSHGGESPSYLYCKIYKIKRNVECQVQDDEDKYNILITGCPETEQNIKTKYLIASSLSDKF